MFTQLLTLPPIPLNSAKEKLKFSPAVEAVVMRALSKQPASRFQDVMAFTKAFQDAASGTTPPPATRSEEEDDSGSILSRFRGILRRNS
jgi:serine/threonine-protein kinase